VIESATPTEGDPERRTVPSAKRDWRNALLAARRAVPASTRRAEAAALTTAAVAAAATMAGPVCCYVPIGPEPGSARLLDALREAGHEVLLPVLSTARQPRGPRPLDWAPYLGPSCLVAGPLRTRQPDTRRLGASAITHAGLVLVPALAVDHHGTRLGRGGGWYDRTLPLAGPHTALVAVVRDEELVPALPSESHDVPMTGVLTPSHGLTTLPLSLD
jgi:5-formyltetrahydrofolate cyclo-ligase